MSSPDSGSLVSTISHNSPIPKLIKHIKHSFRERDFNEVQKILMDRENNMKMEIENLIRNRDSMKEEVCLLKRIADLAELEKSKVKEKLHKNQRKCEGLEETDTKLLEEKLVSSDREKRSEELYGKLYAQNSEMINEKNKSIFELNEKINELKTKNLEIERLVGVYKEKCKCLDTKVVKMGQEIEDLRNEKLAAVKTVEELRRKLSEANRAAGELRLKKLESDKAAEFNKSRLENLAPRIMKIEELLADVLNVKVGDLANLVGEMCKINNTSEGGNLDFPDFKGRKDSSPGVRLTSNSTGCRSIGLSNKGDKNLAQSLAREDVAHTVETLKYESTECEDQPGSGAHTSSTQLLCGEGCFSNITRSSAAVRTIIEILDSDDEKRPDVAVDISNRGVGSNVEGKRERTDLGEDFIENLISKRTRNMCTGYEDNNVSVDSQTPLQKVNDLNDEDSTDSDESCSDSTIIDLIASLESNKHNRKWMDKADMLQAFGEDEELCMNAVCALYRQKISTGKPTELSNFSKNEGFSPVDSESRRAMAEYLIDGDKELRLRKSLEEVKKQRPDVISQCRKIANIYVEKLFAIYCAGEDPLFSQK